MDDFSSITGDIMDKKKRKEIKQQVLNYYRERKPVSIWDYFIHMGYSETEYEYACFVARKFIERVQIEPFSSIKDIINESDIDVL